MLISCIGHASFLIELDCGLRIVTDPYDDSCGYPVLHTRADAVLISHGHHDHSAADTLQGVLQTIDTQGVHTLSPGVTVNGIPSFHDKQGGAQRGQNAAQGVLLESRAIAGFVWPVIRYLFGLVPDATQKRIDWHPHTPIGWDGWAL